MSQCHLTCSGVKRLPQKCPVVSWWCGLECMVDSGHLISQIFRGRPGRNCFYTPQTSWILEPLMTDHLSPWPNHNFGLHGAPNIPSTNAMLRPHALWHQRHGSWIGLETEAAAQWIRRTSFKTYPIHVWRVHFFKGSWRLSAEICFFSFWKNWCWLCHFNSCLGVHGHWWVKYPTPGLSLDQVAKFRTWESLVVRPCQPWPTSPADCEQF